MNEHSVLEKGIWTSKNIYGLWHIFNVYQRKWHIVEFFSSSDLFLIVSKVIIQSLKQGNSLKNVRERQVDV